MTGSESGVRVTALLRCRPRNPRCHFDEVYWRDSSDKIHICEEKSLPEQLSLAYQEKAMM
uniref:Uncharacterized protein n=1 Tax=Leersia perrieri TaxID=77586 RepID=A0A0D9WT25_9ORYZ